MLKSLTIPTNGFDNKNENLCLGENGANKPLCSKDNNHFLYIKYYYKWIIYFFISTPQKSCKTASKSILQMRKIKYNLTGSSTHSNFSLPMLLVDEVIQTVTPHTNFKVE